MTRAVFKTRCCRLVLAGHIIGSPRSWVMTIPNIFQGEHNPVQKVNAEAKATPEGEPVSAKKCWGHAGPFSWIPNGPNVGSNLVW